MKKLLLISLLALGMEQVVAQVQRKVLIEDMTGTWCGWCPNAMDLIEYVKSEYPDNVIAVSDHGPNTASDVMCCTFSSNLTNDYTAQNGNQSYSYPGVMVDRSDWTWLQGSSKTPQIIGNIVGQNLIESAVGSRFNAPPPPLSIDIASSYNSSTGLVSAIVTANFVDTASGDMRITCLLVEDSVTGPLANDTAWWQENYLGRTCGGNYSSSAYYNYPCSIHPSLTGKVFTHRNVVRYNMAGVNNVWGTASVIPSSVDSGQSFSKTYSYTISSAFGWNTANMKLVAFVSHYNPATALADEVLNAQEVALGQTVAVIENPAAIANISLDAAYPNPFSQITHVNVNIPATQHVTMKVYDLLGNEVVTLANGNLSPGKHTFYWNGKNQQGVQLSNGLYLIRLQTEKQSLAQSIVLSRN